MDKKFSLAALKGEPLYVVDFPLPEGTLFGAVLPPPVPCGELLSIDPSAALALEGVKAVFTAKDIPGENQVNDLAPDEPFLAERRILHPGHPLALVVAESEEIARRALPLIVVEALGERPVFDPREAALKGRLHAPPEVLSWGEPDKAWEDSFWKIQGRADSGDQEHLYMETQSALALPLPYGGVKVFSSTQSPGGTQKTVARILGLPMHLVTVEAFRLGGGFGGKETNANSWAALAALGARLLNRPLRLSLNRREDMAFTGKRHPYSTDYSLGLDREGRILSYRVLFHQDGGAAMDLSLSILSRTLLHATGAYRVPDGRATGLSCRTDHVPRTAFRGFGAPQAFFAIESALFQAAETMKVPLEELKERNLLREGDTLPYGKTLGKETLPASWKKAKALFRWEETEARIEEYNRSASWSRKGAALMPIHFGIAFTYTPLNQASALVNVYTDGSVSVSTGAVEMGQGVSVKISRAVAETLGIPPSRIRMESTDTSRIANSSPTAASTGADLNGEAARRAALLLKERLLAVAAELLGASPEELLFRRGLLERGGKKTTWSWERVVKEAYQKRVHLSALVHYATPAIWFDGKRERGEPFSYYVSGTALVEVTLDTLRGTFRTDRFQVVHDVGSTPAPEVDRGQIEGAFLQGLGWLTLEESRVTPQGKMITDTLTTYKVPDFSSCPGVVDVRFLEEEEGGVRGLLGSKATGEPPFLYGIAGYQALWKAINAWGRPQPFQGIAPLTNERLLNLLVQREEGKP